MSEMVSFFLVFLNLLYYFPLVLINSIIDLTLLGAQLARLLALLLIGLVFIVMNPSNLAIVAC